MDKKKLDWKYKFNKEHIQVMQDTIKKNIKLIAGEKGLTYLRNYDFKLNIPISEEQILSNLKRAFWDKFDKYLRKFPPNYSMIPDLLNDIRDMLKDLVKNNLTFKKELNNNLDVRLYAQMIKNNAFDVQHINKLSDYIISKIQQLCRPCDDEDIKLWKKKIKTDLKNYHKIDLPTFLVDLFKKIMYNIELIKQQSEKFKKGTMEFKKDIVVI